MSEKKEFVLPASNVLQIEQGGGNIFFESGGEFVLPDYMPKVQKVLRMEAHALPPTRYMSSGEAQMSGSVLHTLIYIGEEGEISATVLPAKYEFTIPFSKETETPMVSAAVDVDSLSYRLNGPRKLHIRTRLRAKPRILRNMDITEKQAVRDETQNVHTLFGEVSSLRTVLLHLGDVSVSDTINVESDTQARPIWCGSTAAVSDVRTADGGVNVRGEVHVKVLLDESGKAKMVSKKIPFEEFIDADVQKGSPVTATAHVISTEAAKEQDGEVLVDVVLAVDAAVDSACRIRVLKDAFSEQTEGNVQYQSIQTARLLCSRCGVYTVGGSVAKNAAGAAGLSAILDTSGEASVEETVLADGKLILSGRCALNTVYRNDQGELAAAEYTVPFKISFDCEAAENAATAVSVALVSARTRPDGENLACDMDISLCVRSVAYSETSAVASMDFTPGKVYEKEKYPLCLIYPSGESLWDVAKKHHVSPDRLAKLNTLSISEEDYASEKALAGTKVLMLEV